MNSAASFVIAGMPAPLPADVQNVRHLTRWAMDRLDTISFFLVLMLGIALAVKLIWNSLGRNVAWLPRLTYPGSVGVVFLWSLAFVIVLTMISGARELMTPGAWEKDNYTYRLGNQAEERQLEPAGLLEMRRRQLSAIHRSLAVYAKKHGDQFPRRLNEIDKLEPRPPLHPNRNYEYRLPSKTAGNELVVLEPIGAYEGPRLALSASGVILVMHHE